MAKLSLAIETSEAQDTALAWLLTTQNTDRISRDLKPHDDVLTLLIDILTTAIADYQRQYQESRKGQIATALDNASPDQWAKICDVLGMKSLPGGEAVAAVSVVP